MRILYIDIDSLRPDHLGCYGYHRATSPNIDKLARDGMRFEHCYAPDTPCLPSRTGLFSGRCGYHTGVVNHGGAAADPFTQGPGRGFRDVFANTCWMTALRHAGYRTATVSPFGERHGAWHWYAGFNEIYNPGKGGMESAEEISPLALDWIRRNGRADNWFLHVNFWDPHTPYRAPAKFGDPFKDEPIPEWLTAEVRQQHWGGCGPHSAREITGFECPPKWPPDIEKTFPRQPVEASSMEDVRKMFDGYDAGVRYADEHAGRLLNALANEGVLDETIIMVSADHGENLGELNIYGDHQVADAITNRVPMVVRWPGVTDRQAGRSDAGLIYQYDFAATLIEGLGGEVPDNWDGRSFHPSFKAGREDGRDYLVIAQNVWSCQRSVRWKDYLCVRSYHDGYHGFPDIMLFNVKEDPHEQHNLAEEKPELVNTAMAMLAEWQAQMARTATHHRDPMLTVLGEGGPHHTRGELPAYIKRLRQTDRSYWADHLAAKHSREC